MCEIPENQRAIRMHPTIWKMIMAYNLQNGHGISCPFFSLCGMINRFKQQVVQAVKKCFLSARDTDPTEPPPEPIMQRLWQWRRFRSSSSDLIRTEYNPLGVVFLWSYGINRAWILINKKMTWRVYLYLWLKRNEQARRIKDQWTSLTRICWYFK